MATIFVSYRRESKANADAIAARLFDWFGKSNVFLDVETIGPGDTFEHRIKRHLEDCAYFLLLIDEAWLDRQQDLASEDDWVAKEILLARKRHARIIPVLIRGVEPPSILPSRLAWLSDLDMTRIGSKDGDIKEVKRDVDHKLVRHIRRWSRDAFLSLKHEAKWTTQLSLWGRALDYDLAFDRRGATAAARCP